MNYIVEVRYTGSDWADLVADMRSWLDRRQIEAQEIDHFPLGRGIVGFICRGSRGGICDRILRSFGRHRPA